eukprot:11728213-Prorocentrum_lima.AAC.1
MRVCRRSTGRDGTWTTSSPRMPPGRHARCKPGPPVFLSAWRVRRASWGSRGSLQQRHVALRAPPAS